jgi:hypothetical protein
MASPTPQGNRRRAAGRDRPSSRKSTRSEIWCSALERLSLTEFLTEDDSTTDGPQGNRRTGSTRFWDVSSTDGRQATGRTIGGGLRIWRLGVRIPRGALTSGFELTHPMLVLLDGRELPQKLPSELPGRQSCRRSSCRPSAACALTTPCPRRADPGPLGRANAAWHGLRLLAWPERLHRRGPNRARSVSPRCRLHETFPVHDQRPRPPPGRGQCHHARLGADRPVAGESAPDRLHPRHLPS